ncbi:alpha/beta fold hydrolase [Aquitalea pelogenes]|uniref:alpha/beta fold hydrolase n=1 Tax=Aquitalea pelogenes TaxID=1293573 RepID=UPI000788F3C4|nr:alpha/beta hydrolase [Aquitalea pelogenes]
MPHLALGSHSVFYEISGHGQQDLLLFNGITMSTPAWGLMMPALESQYRVIRFDFLGQGQTDKPVADKYTLAEQADLAAALLDALQLSQVFLVGLSYGGMVAQHFAHRHGQRVRKLLLASTLAWSDEANNRISQSWIECNQAGGLDLRYSASIPWLFSSRFLTANAAMLEDMKTLAGMVDWDAVIRLINGVKEHDARNWLPQLQIPCHILLGAEDRLTPLYQAEILQQRIPHATLEQIPHAAHVLHIEAAEAFSRSIIRFCQP